MASSSQPSTSKAERPMPAMDPNPAPASPRPLPQKGVTIFDEPEHIEPVNHSDDDDQQVSPTLVACHAPKLHRASITGKKMTGRPALSQTNSSTALASQISALSLENPEPCETPAESKAPDLRALLSQVVDWLQEEKSKRQSLHHHRHKHVYPHRNRAPSITDSGTESTSTLSSVHPQQRASTADSDVDLSLDKLDSILSGYTALTGSLPKLTHKSSSSLFSRKGSIAKVFSKRKGSIAPQSSDTEFFGDEVMVPNVEATLDNTKTTAFCGGSPDADTSDQAKRKDYKHWVKFKEDIVRLTHTLRLKGWRRIPIDRAADIDVARLSGALTNAVYVVRPPKNMADYATAPGTGTNTGTQTPASSAIPGSTSIEASSQSTPFPSKRKPIILLLRIYGPQVEHLIDRDSELAILRRLCRKNIGPRLLGTFDNGRFEEFLHATTLTAEDLRVPETSKQIAKRMRELHDGIDLLDSEIDSGPAVFASWDKWVDRVEKIITFLDQQVLAAQQEQASDDTSPKPNPRYTRRGFICGVEWPIFRKAYDEYRRRIVGQYGGTKKLNSSLIFAHNDTQYGNLMRLNPSGTSPLLQPSNHHKQLIVIDFEYAGQNTRGHEFANHFTEWCYNYHHPEKSWVCDTRGYPDEKEQYRFLRSYVMHRPQFAGSASATPKMEAREKTNITDFMLDARAPGSTSTGSSASTFNLPAAAVDYERDESEREKRQEEEIQKLLDETRLWRLSNSAHWVAWGIVQAKVPELDDKEEAKPTKRILGGVLETVKELGHAGRSSLSADRKQAEDTDKDDKEEADDTAKSQSSDVPAESHTNDTSLNTPQNQDGAEHSRQALDEGDDESQGQKSPAGEAEEEEEEEEEEFDYLAYAQDRAMFFWGDCVQMGIVKEEELPEDLRHRIKKVSY
ncbi:hypothetical protein PV10_03431 [Exophiala mesophila]|uniref:Choline kinase N-terminal domain-containing protein n=1 Tax=Exophiala mesophila TaxID=212818 RepID=A0A0D1X214_EXOME|nr:uncharacterized protein PV10_03431 [Exophiala mesophila]KIV95825.1 hypothetical protein PV10_03431 [Exophiala mesophila]